MLTPRMPNARDIPTRIIPPEKRNRGDTSGYSSTIPATATADICKPRSNTDNGDRITMQAKAKNSPSSSTRGLPMNRSTPHAAYMHAARKRLGEGWPSHA